MRTWSLHIGWMAFCCVGVGAGVFGSACRQERAARQGTGAVLAVAGQALHLLDHVASATVIDIPGYEEPVFPDQAVKAFEALLEEEPYAPRELPLFPIPVEKLKLRHVRVDTKTGQFLTRPADRTGRSTIEVPADVDLGDYDVLSIRIGSDVGGPGGIAWRRSKDTALSDERSVAFDFGRGGPPVTFHYVLRSEPVWQLEEALLSLTYNTLGRAFVQGSPRGAENWNGRLSSLVVFPNDQAARVTIESITLRSTEPVRRLADQHGRQAVLALASKDAIAHYGSDAFVRKFSVNELVEDGMLAFPPSEMGFLVDVPAEARLTFGYAVLPISVGPGDGDLRFRVLGEPGASQGKAEPAELFDGLFSVNRSAESFAIVRREVDLRRYAGQRLHLRFRTETADGGRPSGVQKAAGALWFDPTIRRAQPTDRPNVILLSVDTLRADHLGVYGYRRDTSPAIDAFAAEGVVLANAYTTAPWTLPSHMSMMTSLYPLAHGVFEIQDHIGPADQLAPNFTTLAGVLASAGYDTFALTDGGVLFVGAEYGFASGFRLYDERAGRRGVPEFDGKNSARTVQRFLRLLDDRESAPFFAFLHSSQVHEPYYAPPPFGLKYVDPGYTGPLRKDVYQGWRHRPLILEKGGRFGMRYKNVADLKHLINLYDGQIAYFDHNFAALLDGLRQRGVLDNTLFIVTSDHGEEFGERGDVARHGHSLYNELLQVPMILRLPGRIPAGTVAKENVSVVDLMPTILDLCGVPIPDGLQGKSLVPVFAGSSLGPRDIFAGGIRHTKATKRLSILEDAIITGSHKAIEYGAYQPGVGELFDLSRDPKELENLAEKDPERMERLAKEIEVYRQAFPKRSRTAEQGVWSQSDEKRLERLRALGYIE